MSDVWFDLSHPSIVCVGGDGMFTELLNGLIDRKMSDAGKCQTPSEQPIRPDLRIGIIPAGRYPLAGKTIILSLKSFLRSEVKLTGFLTVIGSTDAHS